MDSSTTLEYQFKRSIRKPTADRSGKDNEIIYSFLHGLEALSNLREQALRSLCFSVRLEYHDANDILYCRGELCTNWYILLSGSVFIDGSMFLPYTSFGKRSGGCARRPNECLILEPSEMIAIDYPDVQLMKPMNRMSITQHRDESSARRHTPVANSSQPNGVVHQMNSTHMVSTSGAGEKGFLNDPLDPRMGRGRFNSEPMLELPNELHSTLKRNDPLYHSGGSGNNNTNPMENRFKRHSRSSDTSSAYSGSDIMQSSVDDGEVDVNSLTLEMTADSDDDEEGYEGDQSLIVRDTVRDCLEKGPSDRTEDDIEALLEFMQHFPAFANMTLAIRRALCSVMVFAVVDKARTIVMNDQEELDSWSVILNGHVEIERPDGTIEHLHMGDSFGITPTMEKLYHKGVMRTKVDDCQFVCIAQSDYYKILHQGEENTKRHLENGEVVLVTEHRSLDLGNRKGNIVIRGTHEKLVSQLVEEHSSVDPTYVEDLLLTYRTFLNSPTQISKNLINWFEEKDFRNKVTRVVLLWVNNHFNDFETNAEMCEFLEVFENCLEQQKMGGQLRLLNIACAAKAQPRVIVLTRTTREEILHFSVLGGMERGCGIFISKVEKNSKADEAGLKRGDQILEVNNHNFEYITHTRALEVLRGTTHLSITVKSNLLGFSEMLLTPENSPRAAKKEQIANLQADPKQRISGSSEGAQPVLSKAGSLPPRPGGSASKADRKGIISGGHRAKIRKALSKFNFMPTGRNSSEPQLNSLEDLNSSTLSNSARLPRKTNSTSSTSSSPIHTPQLSASNPDLSSAHQYYDEPTNDNPEYVLKVYRADQTCKYFVVHKETTAREVVMLALREFGINDPSSNYSLCEVSAVMENFVKTKKLPDQLSSLPDRIALYSRYYLKNNLSTDPLVPEEMASELMKEGQVAFLMLNSGEIAAQLTLRDFQLFHQIQSTEYIDDLFELESKYGTPNLQKFSELVNKEMFWVVTEVTREANLMRRMKIIKHFIKVARHCKEIKNFNSMFAIVSGLGHSSVSRLRSTWEKLPGKYSKTFEDLRDLMDPSRNMSKYRNLLNSEMIAPPMIPFFPVVKKDLTFIHLGNDSKVDGLINFEKLRMIAKEIRHVVNMSSAQYDLANILLSGSASSQNIFAAFSGYSNGSQTLRRKRRTGIIQNPKKIYEEGQMVRRVKTYLDTYEILEDENKLSEMSLQCEPAPVSTLRRRDNSPNTSSINLAEKSSNQLGPKFGSDEPDAVRKIMSLASKVQTRNPKQHLPSSAHLQAPTAPPGRTRPPVSPRTGTRPAHAVRLSAESSSVAGTFRKSITSNSIGSAESASPTNSIGSYQQQYETDSGHNSIISSNYDSHSTSSVGSSGSPPQQKRIHPLPGQSSTSNYQLPPNAAVTNVAVAASPHRPPLPPYHIVIQNSAAYSQYWQQQYGALFQQTPSNSSRGVPVLPDYRMATRGRGSSGQANGHAGVARSHSMEGMLNPYGVTNPRSDYYNTMESHQYDDDDDDDDDEEFDTDEEQVSAV